MSNIVNFLSARESCERKRGTVKYGDKQMSRIVAQKNPLICSHQRVVYKMITYLAIESIENKFMLIGDNEGGISLNGIKCENEGQFEQLTTDDYDSSVQNCQWYPIDNGLFHVANDNSVILVDTNSMRSVDKYKFHNKVKFSDWSLMNPSLIAVACSASSIRIIDIRCGNALQQITVKSITGRLPHNITRVLWTPLDSDCLFAGDTSGYIFVYDIRRTTKCLLSVSDKTSYEPITCLTFSKDNMSLLSCHGLANHLNKWIFQHKSLVNSNLHFPNPYIKKMTKSFSDKYSKCQLFCDDMFIYKPCGEGQLDRDIVVNDINTGKPVETQCTSNIDFHLQNINCVTGPQNNYGLLYSAGSRKIRIWTPKVEFKESDTSTAYHQDEWSDGE